MRVLYVTSCAMAAGALVALGWAAQKASQTPYSETLVSEIASRAVDSETLLSSSDEIAAFALDGRDLAWVTVRRWNSYTLHIRRLNTSRTVTVKGIVAGSTQGDALISPLALAKGRALWQGQDHFSNQQYGILVRTTAIEDPVIHDLPCCDLYVDEAAGPPAFPIAGRGDVLVYYSHCDTDEGSPECSERAVRRVRGSDTRKIFDIETPSFLAVDSGRIALVWARSRKGELRSVEGELLGSFKLQRRPRAIALSRSFLAVMTNGGQIELFSATAGSSLGVLRVPWRVAPMIAASGDWVAFAVGRAITAVDLRGGQTTRLRARAEHKPFGLTISSRRVAWGEDLTRGSRIRTFLLPT